MTDLREAAQQALGTLKALGAENGYASEALRTALAAIPAPASPSEPWQAALQKAAELAEAKAEELVDRWKSNLGATAETKAAGVAAHLIADLQGDIIALQIQCERTTRAPVPRLTTTDDSQERLSSMSDHSCKTSTPAPVSHLRGRSDGHCGDDAAWEQFSKDYENRTRADLCKGDLTDFALANAQFMCDRNSLDLIVYQTAAKERIRWLSIQLASALSVGTGDQP